MSQGVLFSELLEVFKNVGEAYTAKNYRPVSSLSGVSKVLEKLANNRLVNHQEKCGLFSNFQCGFRSRQPTAYLLSVVPETIAIALNTFKVTGTVALYISKAFDRV